MGIPEYAPILRDSITIQTPNSPAPILTTPRRPKRRKLNATERRNSTINTMQQTIVSNDKHVVFVGDSNNKYVFTGNFQKHQIHSEVESFDSLFPIYRETNTGNLCFFNTNGITYVKKKPKGKTNNIV